MKDYQKEYKKAYAKALKENFSLVRKQLRDKDTGLMKKITNRAKEYGISESAIIKDIQKCDTAIIPFAKNPAKQNFYENTACQMIQNMIGVENFQKLPNHSTYVCNDSSIQREELKTYPTAKTIDFKWEYKDYTIYASHKYTKDSGGSQDNQYKDLQEFIKQSRDTKLPKVIFIAIADGDYYMSENGRAGTTKMEHLASLCTRKVIACRMENLIEQLNSVCK